ncbi:MAG: hypothetical protein ABI665_18090 [Vicinamibacterales bacterium]
MRTRVATFAFCLLPFAFSNEPFAQRSAGRVEILKSVGGLPPAVVGQFREPIGFEQASWGQYVVFDRRGHAVYGIDETGGGSRKIVEIGGEDGRVIEPSAFDAAPDGSFAVADAPNGRERVQVFDAGGFRRGGFLLPGKASSRVVLGSLTLNGIGSLVYTGRSVLLSLPDTGWLLTEYGLLGTPTRSIGLLRATGHEDDRELHFTLNAGIALPDPDGGFYFVFIAGVPAFRKYDAQGQLVFERVIQGREIDPVVAALPQRWPRRSVNGGELPLVTPTIRAAAVDGMGRLWVSFVVPFTYVYDPDGEKVRTVQFRGAGIISPSSLSFSSSGRVLVTPGCYEFLPD